jgi:hypothetical protein
VGGRAVSTWLLPLVLLTALLAPLRALASVPAPAEARERARKLLDKAYQTSLPEDEKPALDPTVPARPRHERPADADVEVPAGGSMVASGIMWVIVGIAVLLLIAFVVSEFGGYGENVAIAPAGDGAAVETAAESAAVVERPLDDAEALARAGRFGEAIHVLLLRTLEELVRRLERPLPRSKTSREILVEVRLPDEARGALSHLVSAVEVSFFGGSEPGASDYQVCVERFRRFADAYTRGVRA